MLIFNLLKLIMAKIKTRLKTIISDLSAPKVERILAHIKKNGHISHQELEWIRKHPFAVSENGISPLRLDGYDFYFMTQLAYIANM